MTILFIIVMLIICFCFLSYSKSDKSSLDFKYDRNKLTYNDLLHDQNWYDFRKRILLQHDCMCDWCNTKTSLQVHHKVYYKYPNGKMFLPWNYPDDKMMVLCDKCHRKYHDKYKVNVYYKRYN